MIPERLVKRIPESVGLDAAALTEPLACVVHGVMELARISAGDVVLICLAASQVVDVPAGDAAQCVRELTAGRGADAAIECAGVEKSAALCLEVLRKRGRYIQTGLFGKPVRADLDMMSYKEIRHSCSFASTQSSFRTALRLMDCALVNPVPLISARLPLDQWEEGFRLMKSKEGIKVLFYPD